MESEMLSIPDSARAAVQEETEKTFAMIGLQIRRMRQRRRMTIQQLADASGMSASMLMGTFASTAAFFLRGTLTLVSSKSSE